MHTGLRTQGWSLNFEWLDYLSTLRTTVHGPLRLAKGLIPAKRCEPAAHLMCQWCWHIRPDLPLLVCVWGHIWQGVNNPLRPSIIWLWTRPKTRPNQTNRDEPDPNGLVITAGMIECLQIPSGIFIYFPQFPYVKPLTLVPCYVGVFQC